MTMSQHEINNTKIILDGESKLGGLCIKTEGYTSRDNYDLFNIFNANEVPASNYIGFVRHRGTLENPQPMENNDEIFSLFWAGWDSANQPCFAAELTVGSEGEITVGHVPSYFDFKVVNDKGLINSVLKIHNNGTISLNKESILDETKVGKQSNKFLRIKIDGTEYALPLFFVSND